MDLPLRPGASPRSPPPRDPHLEAKEERLEGSSDSASSSKNSSSNEVDERIDQADQSSESWREWIRRFLDAAEDGQLFAATQWAPLYEEMVRRTAARNPEDCLKETTTSPNENPASSQSASNDLLLEHKLGALSLDDASFPRPAEALPGGEAPSGASTSTTTSLAASSAPQQQPSPAPPATSSKRKKKSGGAKRSRAVVSSPSLTPSRRPSEAAPRAAPRSSEPACARTTPVQASWFLPQSLVCQSESSSSGGDGAPAKRRLFPSHWVHSWDGAFRGAADVSPGRTLVPRCGTCARPFPKVLCGGGCRTAAYCDAACARTHWPYHSEICGSPCAGDDVQPLQLSSAMTGLMNTGLTCYANAVIQCLVSVRPLARYFLADGHLRDNPQGEMARLFANLVKDIVLSRRACVLSPHELRRAVAKLAFFEEHQQADAQEWLIALLHGLSTELNVVARPAKGVAPVSARSSDPWFQALHTERSFVDFYFAGQAKSTLECTDCGFVSAVHEPFRELLVGFPPDESAGRVLFRVVLVKASPQHPRLRVVLSMDRRGRLGDLQSAVAERAGMHLSRLWFVSVVEGRVRAEFTKADLPLSLVPLDSLVAYELDPPPSTDPTALNLLVAHRLPDQTVQGIPYLLTVKNASSLSCREVRALVASAGKRFLDAAKAGTVKSLQPATMRLFAGDVRASSTSSTSRLEAVPNDGKLNFLTRFNASPRGIFFFVLEWLREDDAAEEWGGARLVEARDAEEPRLSAAWAAQRARTASSGESFAPTSFPLDMLLRNHIAREKLDHGNEWECSRCGHRVRAWKQWSVTKLPEVLVVMLKRFERDRGGSVGGKVETMVDFKTQAWDASQALMVQNPTGELYDLFAVINHYGSSEERGHYTAVVASRGIAEASPATAWVEADDHAVRPVEDEAVVSLNAYVLFYKRRRCPVVT